MKSVILDMPPFHSDGEQREFEEFSSTLPGPELITAKYGGGRPHPRDVSRLAYAACTALALPLVPCGCGCRTAPVAVARR